MPKNEKYSAIIETGILGNASGIVGGVVVQKNGVIRIRPLSKKRRKKQVN